jgi:S-methylmethionine-dependent homocysteine/selenocysteine methylase
MSVKILAQANKGLFCCDYDLFEYLINQNFEICSFLRAGADVILTVSYQAFIDGFMKHLGITEDEAIGLIKKSVYLAKQACKEVALETGKHLFNFF